MIAKQWESSDTRGFWLMVQPSQPQPHLTGTRWVTIFRASRRLNSIVEIQRIQGPIFDSQEAAEEHGLKLCKTGLTNDLDVPPTTAR
jgi:hypothetical protein